MAAGGTVALILTVFIYGSKEDVTTSIDTKGVSDCITRSIVMLQKATELLPPQGGVVTVACQVVIPKNADH